MNQSEHTLILIVDDNPTNCELLHRRLTRQGYTCELAYGGKQTLELLEHTKPNLILLDLMMPDMDGLEVLRIIRENHSSSELPVLMVTARNAREDIVTAFEAGANDYVEKPIDFPVLLARIKHQLEHKRLQDEAQKSRTQLRERNLHWQQAHQHKNDLLKTLSTDLHSLSQRTQTAAERLETYLEHMTDKEGMSLRCSTSSCSRYLARLASDAQDLASLEAGQLELHLRPVDLQVLFADIAAKAVQDAESFSVGLAVDIDDNLGVVECDPVRLQQILANLLGHSLRNSPAASRLHLLVSLTASGSICVEVTQHAADMQSRIPHRQETGTERRLLSTELALYLVNKLVALHHGFMETASESEGGTRFTLYLPYSPVSLNAPM